MENFFLPRVSSSMSKHKKKERREGSEEENSVSNHKESFQGSERKKYMKLFFDIKIEIILAPLK